MIEADQPVRYKRGRYITLRTYGDKHDFMSIRKCANNAIGVSPAYLLDSALPSPNGQGRWTSRGFGKIALASVIAAALADGWDAADGKRPVAAPTRRDALRWLPSLKGLLGDVSKYDDEAIDEKIRRLMQDVIDPKTLMTTILTRAANPSVWDYDITAATPLLAPLIKTNPLATMWIMHDPNAMALIEDFAHPGEVITAVRGAPGRPRLRHQALEEGQQALSQRSGDSPERQRNKDTGQDERPSDRRVSRRVSVPGRDEDKPTASLLAFSKGTNG